MNPGIPSAAEWTRGLAARGRYHFSTEEAARGLGVSREAARASLRRLKQRGAVADPFRGFHVIVPPEYQRLGCLPPDQFIPQLMERLGIPYYAGLLSASRYHGAAHQQPQLFQVVVPKNRPPIRQGLVAVEFIARHNAESIPTIRLNTPRGFVEVSSPEATAFDLVGYAHHCGGLSNVATVLVELADRLDPAKLREIAPLSPAPWAQRLGFLLDRVREGDRARLLAEYVAEVVTETVPLSTARSKEGAPRDARWKLAVNVEPELDL